MEGVRFYGGVRGARGGGRAGCGATGVRRYFSQPAGGVRSSPAQLWKRQIKGYNMVLPVKAENIIVNTTKHFYVSTSEKSYLVVVVLYER